MNERKRRSPEILESMVWLVAYRKSATASEINKKIYHPKIGKEPTSKRVYKVIERLINKGYIHISETSNSYVSSIKPLLEIIEKRLKEKNKSFLYKGEEEIISKFLRERPVKDLIGLCSDNANIYIEKEVNGYELVADWMSCLLYAFRQGKIKAIKKGVKLPTPATLNLKDYTRRKHQYRRLTKSTSLKNEILAVTMEISKKVDYPIPSIKDYNLEPLEKILFALPNQVLEKIGSCIREEWKSFYSAGQLNPSK